MPQAPSAPVRLKDIARELNVSVMTVSKVVRGCADVGAETRSRVLAKIKELNTSRIGWRAAWPRGARS